MAPPPLQPIGRTLNLAITDERLRVELNLIVAKISTSSVASWHFRECEICEILIFDHKQYDIT